MAQLKCGLFQVQTVNDPYFDNYCGDTCPEGFMAENFNGHTLNWNASNLASGVYLVRAEAAGQVSFEKLMLLK